MIGAQMNADFQDATKTKMLFRVYPRESASFEAKRIFIIF